MIFRLRSISSISLILNFDNYVIYTYSLVTFSRIENIVFHSSRLI